MTQEQRDALNAVLEYCWSTERDDYADNPESREGHIFCSLVTLENMLQRTTFTPAHWLTVAELKKESEELSRA